MGDMGGIMGKHVSVVMRDALFEKMESERGRESKSSFINHAIAFYFQNKDRVKQDE
tara:strand:+ start:87 stop:254 length:168 start_codon:yes stop_codon:yes gene_type:complete